MKLVRFLGPFSENHKSSQTSRKTSREKSRKVPVVEYRGFNMFQPFGFPRKYQSILDGRATVISVISGICQVSEAAPVVSGAKVLFSERGVEIDSSAEQLTFQADGGPLVMR